MDEAIKDSLAVKDLEEDSRALKKIPPGFSRGLKLPGDVEDEENLEDVTIAPRTNAEVTLRSHLVTSQYSPPSFRMVISLNQRTKLRPQFSNK